MIRLYHHLFRAVGRRVRRSTSVRAAGVFFPRAMPRVRRSTSVRAAGVFFPRAMPGGRLPILAAGLVLAVAAAGCGGGAPDASAEDVPAETSEPGEAGAWEVLFDGGDLARWRGYRRDDVPGGWRVEDGDLAFVPGGEGGDLVTRDTYGDFELELEWRVSPGANSGVFFRGTEDEPWIYQSAPEMQLLDNAGHADGESPLTSAGSNFGLHPVSEDVTRPVGEWNRARIVARGPRVEHWLNGTKVVEYELGSADWERRVAESKFAAWSSYGRAAEGHIGLQDHGDRVWFRDVRVRRLRATGQNP